MTITEKDVAHVAKLARLSLTPEEARRFAAQFERILAHMDELKRLDTERVEPTAHTLGLKAALRPDLVEPFPAEKLLALAPAREGDCFRVKKVLE